MKHLILCLSAVVALCTAALGSAQAVDSGAIMKAVDGQVRVNQGKMYVPAFAGMPIVLNARVLVMDKAKAVVRHTDGCITELGENTLFVLEHPSPCQGGIVGIQTIPPLEVAMPGAVGIPAAGGFIAGLSLPVVAGIGAVVVGGAIAGGIAASSGGDDGGVIPPPLSGE